MPVTVSRAKVVHSKTMARKKCFNKMDNFALKKKIFADVTKQVFKELKITMLPAPEEES